MAVTHKTIRAGAETLQCARGRKAGEDIAANIRMTIARRQDRLAAISRILGAAWETVEREGGNAYLESMCHALDDAWMKEALR